MYLGLFIFAWIKGRWIDSRSCILAQVGDKVGFPYLLLKCWQHGIKGGHLGFTLTLVLSSYSSVRCFVPTFPGLEPCSYKVSCWSESFFLPDSEHHGACRTPDCQPASVQHLLEVAVPERWLCTRKAPLLSLCHFNAGGSSRCKIDTR